MQDTKEKISGRRINSAHLVACLFLIEGCAPVKSNFSVQLQSGEPVEIINYKGVSELDAELEKKIKNKDELAVERKLIPQGGHVYIYNKKFKSRNPITSAVISDGTNKYNCDDAEINYTYYFQSHSSAKKSDIINGAKKESGAHVETSRTEIDCNIMKNLNLPLTIKLIGFSGDTVVVYSISKKE